MSADVRLVSRDQPVHITQLLRSEHHHILCPEVCAVHLVNELLTPEVAYGTWKDFVDLVYKVQDEYCACVATACLVAREERTVSVVLGDVYTVHGTVLPDELSHLRINGPLIIAQLTKNQGILWCQMVAHFLYCCALNAAATYVDVVSDVRNGGFDDQSLTDGMIRTMHKEVRRSFCGAMPLSIFSMCSGFVGTLLVKNFTLFDNRDLFAVTNEQFSELLLTLCMGLHTRLGKLSPLHCLDGDTLRSICAMLSDSKIVKHLAFHAHEQWLVG